MSRACASATGLTLDEGPTDRKAIGALWSLAACGESATGDGVRAALAPLLYTVWQRFLRFDPEDPLWPNRDRVLVGAPEARPLLRTLLHLAGVRAPASADRSGELLVTFDDLRQTGAALPSSADGWSGHELIPGAPHACLPASVQLALHARELADRFNRPGAALFDYVVVAVCSDACVSGDDWRAAASLAAERRLGNLCWIHVGADSEPAAAGRTLSDSLRGEGWDVREVRDAGDADSVTAALDALRAATPRPTLLRVAGAARVPSPEVQGVRVPPGVREHFRDAAGRRGKALRNAWSARVEEYRRSHPDLAEEIDRMWNPSLEKKP